MTPDAQQPRHCDHEVVCGDFNQIPDERRNKDNGSCNIFACEHDTRTHPHTPAPEENGDAHFHYDNQQFRLITTKELNILVYNGKQAERYGIAKVVKRESIQKQRQDLVSQEAARTATLALQPFVTYTKAAALKHGEMVDLMRRNGLKLDDLNDPMQKLAFTFYSEIGELSYKADVVIEEYEETPRRQRAGEQQ